MAHFESWQWADFVRGLCDAPTQSAMHAHLSSGCSDCQRTADTLRAIVVAAREEATLAPPDFAVRYAHAVYSLGRPATKLQRLVARLVYDSAREPLPAGIRAGEALTRRALFAAGDHQVDLQLDRQAASDTISLVGQVIARHQASSVSALPVWLMDRDNVVKKTTCNMFGEFHLEYEPRRHLKLLLPFHEDIGKRVEISLDQLSARKKASPARPATNRRKPRGRA
jgi:hypothetical protein